MGMIKKSALIQVAKARHVSISELAKRSYIARSGFYERLNGKLEFTVSQIRSIQTILNLTDEEMIEIFFNQEKVSDKKTA